MKPFDRMANAIGNGGELIGRPKSVFAVAGANHNFFNTEWQQSDSSGCSGTGHKKLFDRYDNSDALHTTGLAAVSGFFRAHVGSTTERSLAQLFDSYYNVNQVMTGLTQFQRAYLDSAAAGDHRLLIDLSQVPDGETGAVIADHGTHHTISGVPGHDEVLKALALDWNNELLGPTNTAHLSIDWQAQDLSLLNTLSFRISRTDSPLNTIGRSQFHVALVGRAGRKSEAVALSDYLTLIGPLGGPYDTHYLLETVRIPLQAFAQADLTDVRGVEFIFDQSPSGAVVISDLAANRDFDVTGKLPAAPPAPPVSDVHAETVEPTVIGNEHGNTAAIADDGTDHVSLTFSSDFSFPANSNLPELWIGSAVFRISRLGADHNTLTFSIPRSDYEAVVAEAPDAAVTVNMGAGLAWDFGWLDTYLP